MNIDKKTLHFVIAGCLVLVFLTIVSVILVQNPARTFSRHIELAQKYIDAANYEQAVSELEAAIAEDPAQPDPYLMLADLYTELEAFADALTILTKGYDITGDDAFSDRIEALEKILAASNDVSTGPDIANSTAVSEAAADTESVSSDNPSLWKIERDKRQYADSDGAIIGEVFFDQVIFQTAEHDWLNEAVEEKHREFLDELSDLTTLLEKLAADHTIHASSPYLYEYELKSVNLRENQISIVWNILSRAGDDTSTSLFCINKSLSVQKDLSIADVLQTSDEAAKKLILDKTYEELYTMNAYDDYLKYGNLEEYQIEDFNFYFDEEHIYVYYVQNEILNGNYDMITVMIR